MKTAKTQYPVLEIIKNRWSARSFAQQPVADEAVLTMLEAANWAASSNNEQPWQYYYAHKSDGAFTDFVSCLSRGNRLWAKDAGVLLLCAGRKKHNANGSDNYSYLHDCGAANANLMLQATALEVYGHLMAGFDREKTKNIFKLSQETEPVVFIALGYLGRPDDLAEPFHSREITPRTRRPLNEFVTHVIDPVK